MSPSGGVGLGGGVSYDGNAVRDENSSNSTDDTHGRRNSGGNSTSSLSQDEAIDETCKGVIAFPLRREEAVSAERSTPGGPSGSDVPV